MAPISAITLFLMTVKDNYTKRNHTKLIYSSFLVSTLIIIVVWSPNQREIGRELSNRYGVDIRWAAGGKFDGEKLLVEGKELKEYCHVEGEYGNIDDVIIECGGSEFDPEDIRWNK